MAGNTVTRVTEQSNPRTWNIDKSDPREVAHQIAQCELEIFEGWMEYQNIYSRDIIQGLEDVVEQAVQIIKNPDRSCIVMSGSGTSGRLAFYVRLSTSILALLARQESDVMGWGLATVAKKGCQLQSTTNQGCQLELYKQDINRYLKQELGLPGCCEYLLSGDDLALLRSSESQEDDAVLGSKALEQLCEGKDSVLYIGITCGLSAAYVAGQIDYSLKHLDKVFPVLVGFNPLSQARDHPIENWNQTCASVFNRLYDAQEQNRGVILNPVIGPEPITGSSRMKGGTTTKVLLDLIFQVSLHRAMEKKPVTDQMTSSGAIIKNLLDMYHEVFKSVPKEFREEVGKVITVGGESLINGGHIYYLGEGLAGMLGLIDASECPPTFGADFEDIRGFLQGGFTSWGNTQGDLGEDVDISLLSFEKNYLWKLGKHDTVILIGSADKGTLLSQTWGKVQETSAKSVHIQDGSEPQEPLVKGSDACIQVDLRVPWSRLHGYLKGYSPSLQDQIKRNLLQIAMKRTLNMISTGAHVVRGKVYHNYMIDLKLSNNKLFFRGINIIVKLLGVSEEDAREAILRSIHRCDIITDKIRNSPISNHVLKASVTHKVLPLTILLLTAKGSTIEGALQNLDKYTTVRTAYEALIKK